MKNIILQFRKNNDYSILEPFKYKEVNDFDENYWKRGDFIFTLYDMYQIQDKPLIKWLIEEELKGVFKIEDDMLIVCAFMLYKIMSNEDILTLYDIKFGGGSDLVARIDTELIFGIDKEITKAYLEKLKTAKSEEILECIQYYESHKEAVYRTREEYIEFFEKKRMIGLKEYFEEEKVGYQEWIKQNNA